MNNALELYRGTERGQLVPANVATASASAADKIDMRLLISIFRRRIRLFFGVLATIVLLGLVLTLHQTPAYVAMAEVAVNAHDEQLAPAAAGTTAPAPALAPTSSFVDTQVQVLQSRALAERVADALHLTTLAATGSSGRVGLRMRLMRLVGLAPPADAVLSPEEIRQEVLDFLQANVSVLRLGETYALSIGFQSADPQRAAAIANAYATQYTNGQLSTKRDFARTQGQFLAGRLEQLRAQAQADTGRVQQYRIANNLLSTSGASLTEQEISSYNQAVAQARAQAAEDEARLDTAQRQLRSGSTGEDVGAALESPVVSALRSRQADAAGLLASLESRYGPLHPDVQKARSAVADIDLQIRAEIRRVISNLQAKARVSQQRLGSLTGSLSGARGTLAQNNAAMVGLDDLQRRAGASQALYDSYLNSYKEATAREGTELPDATILSAAEVPVLPSSPNLLLAGFLSVAIGVGAGLAAAFLAEMNFSGLTTGDEVEARLHAFYLGSIPSLRSVVPEARNPILSIIEQQRSGFAEAFRSLRASIRYATSDPVQVVAVTSALPQEGKTISAVCLARSAAQAGEKVVLVDCDLRQHGVSRLLRGTDARPGLVEVLRGATPLAEALIHDEQSGMSILPIAAGSESYTELLTGDEMDSLLAQLRQMFGMIVIDTAPVLPIADTRLIVGKADVALCVARWRSTPDHAIRAALRLLPAQRVRFVGVALTRVDMNRQAKFGLGDGSAYYRAYKSYYA